MKTKYAKQTSILREIYEEINYARQRGREIAHFEFSEDEVKQIKAELGIDEPYKRGNIGTIVGIPFKVVDAEGKEVL